MNIEHFDDLLAMARAQPEPQRLLMVFAAAELEEGATPAQREAHAAGHGGVLRPLMCVAKDPHEVSDFQALAKEAREAGPPWTLVLVAALSGRSSAQQVDQALDLIVRRVETGELEGVIAFDRSGEALHLAA